MRVLFLTTLVMTSGITWILALFSIPVMVITSMAVHRFWGSHILAVLCDDSCEHLQVPACKCDNECGL